MNKHIQYQAGKSAISDLPRQIAEQIVEYAQNKSLRKGTPLRAQPLADFFSVSRTPIVEALNYLAELGIVCHLPRRGFELATDGANLDILNTRQQLRECDHVYDRFAEVHLRDELPKRFTETSLRRKLNITKVQLQNLLTRLLKEGLVDPAPGYGWVLNDILLSGEAVEQSYHFRMIIEPAAILETSFRPDLEALSDLQDSHQAMLDGAMFNMTQDEIFNTNVEFHEVLIGWTHNSFLLDALKKQNALRRLLVRSSGVSSDRHKRILQEHLALLSALERNQFVEASHLMKRHLAANARTVGAAIASAGA